MLYEEKNNFVALPSCLIEYIDGGGGGGSLSFIIIRKFLSAYKGFDRGLLWAMPDQGPCIFYRTFLEGARGWEERCR